MTNEELIQSIQDHIDSGVGEYEGYGLTLDECRQVIKALEQQPCDTAHRSSYGGVSWGGTYIPKEQQSCEDCIRRQEVNELVDELARAISDERSFMSRGRSTSVIMEDILHLPSVKPQPEFYPPCQDCNTKMDEVRKAYDKLRWITNHEILPEDLQRVLITTLKGYVTDYIHMNDVSIWDFAIAWMPAPEPYKGGM